MRKLDLTNKKFNLLTAIQISHKDKDSNIWWKFKCDCGKFVTLKGSFVKQGKNKSCGCLGKEQFIGQRFGKLIVLNIIKTSKRRKQWLCQCDCGKQKIISSYSLKNKKIKSCGCLRKESTSKRFSKDLSNQIFDKLTVIKFSHVKNGRRFWLCKCECGKECIINSKYLLNGDTKSCGCSHNYHNGTLDISKGFFTKLKYSAKIRKLEFNITIEYIQQLLINQNYKCALSGIPIQCSWNTYKRKYNSFKEQTASLDRIDNKKGYIESNVQWVHKDINKIKMNFTELRLYELCNAIINYQKEKLCHMSRKFNEHM